MVIFSSIVFGLCAIVMVGCLVLLVRNEAVYRFRQRLLQDMMDRATGGTDPEVVDAQLKAYLTVPYQTMVYKFWKPLNEHEWFEGTALDIKVDA